MKRAGALVVGSMLAAALVANATFAVQAWMHADALDIDMAAALYDWGMANLHFGIPAVLAAGLAGILCAHRRRFGGRGAGLQALLLSTLAYAWFFVLQAVVWMPVSALLASDDGVGGAPVPLSTQLLDAPLDAAAITLFAVMFSFLPYFTAQYMVARWVRAHHGGASVAAGAAP